MGYLNLPFTATQGASTPDHTSFAVTDLDVRLYVYMRDAAKTTSQTLIGQGNVSSGAASASWELRQPLTGTNLQLIWRESGGTVREGVSNGELLEDGQSKWVRATLDVDNGAGQYTLRFYYSEDPADTDPAAVSWTLDATVVGTTGVTSINNGTESLRLGNRNNTDQLYDGQIHYAEVRNGIGGTIVTNPDWRTDCQQDSATQLTDDQGRVWTVNGTATWVDPIPCGGPAAYDETGRLVTVAATISRSDALNGGFVENVTVVVAATISKTEDLTSVLEEYTDLYQDQYYGSLDETDQAAVAIRATVTSTDVQSGIATELGRLVSVAATVASTSRQDGIDFTLEVVIAGVVVAVDNLTQAGGPPPPPIIIPPTDILSAPALSVVAGLELLDANDQILEDISADLVGGAVTRRLGQAIHGVARFTMARAINWHSQRLRPYLTITELIGGLSQRWDLGIYLPETPTRHTGLTPATFEVEAYDKLVVLANPHGIGYTLAAGAAVVGAVEALLDEQGLAHNIEPGSTTLAAARSWPLDPDTTTLGIVNELLASIGYAQLWADRTGTFRSGPIRPPASQIPVYHYDTGQARTVVGESITEELDLFNVPNRWTFVRDDPALGPPSEGDGIYTVTNATDGPTSIASRGRVINRVELLDAADQAALVVRGNEIVQQDRQPFHFLQFTSVPNPNHWHADAVTVSAAELGLVAVTFAEQEWTLPLDGADMTHKVRRAVTV